MRRQRFREQLQSGEVLALDPTALTLMFGASAPREVEHREDGVAVLTIEGPLEHRSGGCWDSYEGIVARFEECIASDDVRAVVLRIDSPGGETDGLLEAVRSLRDAKEAAGKPVIAFADECAASAAYALACAADEIYLPEAAGVGSIGVVATLLETTARDEAEGFHYEVIASGDRKTDGNPHVAITAGARKRATARVQQLAGMFFELVSKSRGVSVDDVDALEADVFYGQSAVDLGLADGVMTWPEVLGRALEAESNTAATGNASVSNRPPRGARGVSTMKIDALKSKKATAKAALSKATTEKQKREAGTAYRKATVALALAEASLEARKMKKTKYVEETLSEDEPGAEDAEDDADAEDEADAEDDGDDTDAEDAEDDADAKKKTTITHEDDEDGDEDDGDDGDDDGDAKKMRRASLGGMSLEATLAKLTGKKSRSAMIGAIEGALRASEQATHDVAKMKAREKATKIKSLLADACKAGRITPGEKADLQEAAEAKGAGWLRAYLEKRPAIVPTEEILPKEFAGLKGKIPADAAAVFAKMGLSKEQAEKAGALFAERHGQNGVTR